MIKNYCFKKLILVLSMIIVVESIFCVEAFAFDKVLDETTEVNPVNNNLENNNYLDIDEYIEASSEEDIEEEIIEVEEIKEDDISLLKTGYDLNYTPDSSESFMDKYSFQNSTTKGYPLYAKLLLKNIGSTINKYGSLSNTSSSTELKNVDLKVYIDNNLVSESSNRNRMILYNYYDDLDTTIYFQLGFYKWAAPGLHDISFEVTIKAYDKSNREVNLKIQYSAPVYFVDESSTSSERIYPNDCRYLSEQFSDIEIPAGDNIKIENVYLLFDLDRLGESINSVEMVKSDTTEVVATIPRADYNYWSSSNSYKSNERNLKANYIGDITDNNYYYDYYTGYLTIDNFTIGRIEDNTEYDFLIKTTSGRVHRYEKVYKGMTEPFVKRIGVNNVFLSKYETDILPVLRNNYITAVIYGINFSSSTIPNFYSKDRRSTVTEYNSSDINCGYEKDDTGWYHYYTLKKKPGFDDSIVEEITNASEYGIDYNNYNYKAVIGFDYPVKHADSSTFYEYFEADRFCTCPLGIGNGYTFINYEDSRGYIYLEKDFAAAGDIVEITFPIYSFRDYTYNFTSEKYTVKNENGDLYIHLGPSNKIWNNNNDNFRLEDYVYVKNITKGSDRIRTGYSLRNIVDINRIKDEMSACSYWEIHNFYDASSNVIITGSGRITDRIKEQIKDNRIYRICFKDINGNIIGSRLFNISSNMENTDKPVVLEDKEEIIEDDYTISGNTINATLACKGKLKIDLLSKKGYGAWVIVEPGDKKIASITKKGVISGKSVGKTTIILNCNDILYTININVENPMVKNKKVYINKGESVQIELLNTTLKKDYVSKKPSVAKVSDEGIIKGVSCGKAKIVIKVGGKLLFLNVFVEDPKMPYENLEIVNGKVAKIKILNTKNKVDEWYSSDMGIVTVEKGKLTPIATGTATVSANVNGRTLSCNVYVDNPEISKGQMVLNVGQKEYLKMYKTKFDYEWKTTNQEVAAVLSNGKVIGKSKGNAVIYTKINGRKYRCLVTVQ